MQGKPQSDFAANFSAGFLSLHQFSSPYRTYEEHGKLKKLPAKSDYNTPPFGPLPSPPEKVALHLTGANIAVVDVDNCFRKDGSPKPWAEPFLMKYTKLTPHEFSASARGAHFFFDIEPDIPKAEYITVEEERKGCTEDDDGHVDLFVNTRWLALTARPLFGKPHPTMMKLDAAGLAALKAELAATGHFSQKNDQPPGRVLEKNAKIAPASRHNYLNNHALKRLRQGLPIDEVAAILPVVNARFTEPTSEEEVDRVIDDIKKDLEKGKLTVPGISGPLFDTREDFERAGNLVWQIEGISYQGEVTGNVALQKNGKSWYVMSKMRALLSGDDWMGRKVAKAKRVNYYVPEVGRASVYRRMKAMQLDQYLGRTLFVRTSALGVPDLRDEEVLESCAGADVFMDTLIRFLDGPENNAEVIKGFAEKVFSLLAVARNVEINCHTQKSYANKDEMGPDMFRGSGDITAFLSNGYGLMQTDSVKNEIFVKCLFSRDLPEETPSFVLQGREENGVSIIDRDHDFKLVTSNAGSLREHKKNPKLKNMTSEQEAKLRELHAQGMSTRAIAEALGLKSHVTIANWKKELGLTKPKPEEDPVTDHVLELIGGNSQ